MYTETRSNKFNTKRTEYGGFIYQSKFEAGQAEVLDWRVKAKELTHWDRQVRFEYNLIRKGDDFVLSTDSLVGKEGIRLESYYLDFVAYRTDGIKEYIEVKGLKTTTWRRKWRLMEFLYGSQPDIEMIVISMGRQYKSYTKK